jgi:predicted TIM-barrel fold metal-dependent hydrolase
MKKGFRIIDAEPHLMETADLWAQHLDEPYRARTKLTPVPPAPGRTDYRELALEVVASPRPGVAVSTDAGPPPAAPLPAFFKYGNQRLTTAHPNLVKACTGQCTPEVVLDSMDTEGIDIAVVMPTFTMMIIRDDALEPDHVLALCRAFNDSAYAFTQANPARLKFWAFLPPHDPMLAAQEARRCVEELGAAALAMSKGAIQGHLFSDPFFDPLWEELNRLGVPLGLHGPPGGRGNMKDRAYFRERYRGHRRMELVQSMSQGAFFLTTTVGEFILGGVLERFPNLNIVLQESATSWIPWLLWLMDEEWKMYEGVVDYTLAMKPSEYFRRQCYAVVNVGEDVAKYVVDCIGDQNLLVSGDYAHVHSPFPDAIDTFLALDGISDASKRRILWDNPARLFCIGG